MTPEQLAKPDTEHAHQRAFFCACNQLRSDYPCLEFMFAIPNGGERNKAVAARMKAEGVKVGVPDTMLPFPKIRDGRVVFHGLYIEFKRPQSCGKAAGRLSPEQERWRDFLVANNFRHFVAYSYCDAINCLLDYLN